MTRNGKRTIQNFLRAIHRQTPKGTLPDTWSSCVMREIALSGRFDIHSTNLERMAPRFAMVAVSLSALLVMTATWVLHSLPSTLYSAYSAQMFNFIPASLASM